MYIYKKRNIFYIGLTPRESLIYGIKSFSTRSTNRKTAEEIKRDLQKSLRIGDLPSTRYKYRPALYLSTARDLYALDRINTGRPLSKLTLEAYDKAFKYIESTVGIKAVSEYTRSDYYAFIAGMTRAQLSQNTMSIYSHRIYAIFNFLVKEGYIQNNPFKKVTEKKYPVKVPTNDEIKQLIEYSRSTKFSGIIRLMMFTGLRASEAVNLKAEDIKTESINVQGKGNKTAAIPITSEIRSVLDSITIPPEGRIFKFDYNAIRHFFYRFEKASFIRMRSHDLRKFCISRLANAGVNIYFVRDFARHSDIKTTLAYYAKADRAKIATEIDSKVTPI